MGKCDDFDLDLKKVMSNNTASEAESVVSILQTLATECFTFDGSNTCNCPSTDCSPCDMTTSCRRADPQIMRC